MEKMGIIPGEQIISVISAMSGGFGEEILREIAHPKRQPENGRHFDEWQGGSCSGFVIIKETGEKRDVLLRIGEKDGLFLSENGHNKLSFKHECDGDVCMIPIVRNKHRKGRLHLVDTIANNIVGIWVIHGKKWRDRSKTWHPWPYGIDEARKAELDFAIFDGGGCTYEEMLQKGPVRSTHPGEWNRSVTLVPAASEVPILIHEFEERADGKGKNDLTVFRGQQISDDKEIWGPYARWSENIKEVDFGDFSEIAKVSASPFAFHMKATRNIFPSCELGSVFLLRTLEKKKIRDVLEMVAKKDPERFYRLIDEEGKTWKLKAISKEQLIFRRDDAVFEKCFSLSKVSSNVLGTFEELASIQENPRTVIRRTVRIVPDTHFFIVLFGIMTAKNGESHLLSGNHMHEYLLKGKDAYAHRIRNDRLFCYIRDLFGMEKLKYFVYPSSSLRLSAPNQYTFDPKKWNKEYWLKKKLY